MPNYPLQASSGQHTSTNGHSLTVAVRPEDIFCPFPEVAKPEHPPLIARAMAARGFSVTVVYPPGYPVEEGEAPHEGKRPSGKAWGAVTLEPREIEKKVSWIYDKSGLIANNGVCLGPGKAPGGHWLTDIEADGPQGNESFLKLTGGEDPPTLSFNSRRGPHRLFAVDGARLAKLLTECGATEGKGNEAGVFKGIDALPDLEFRVGGYHANGKLKQLQSVCAPSKNADGTRRKFTGGPDVAELPEAAYEFLEAIAEEIKKSKAEKPSRGKAKNAGARKLSRATNRMDAYWQGAVSSAAQKVEAASEGDRNTTLNSESFSLGTLIGAGLGNRSEAESQLGIAARRAGLANGEIVATIASGLDAGILEPRNLSEIENKLSLSTGVSASPGRADLPEVYIQFDEMAFNDEMISALASNDDNIYKLGGVLATIVNGDVAPRGVEYLDGQHPQIVPIEPATLRERMASAAKIMVVTGTGEDAETLPAHPPQWSVLAIHKRGNYPGIKPILGLIESPTIRPDGSILSNPGYDEQTRLYYEPRGHFDSILERPTREDAERCKDALLDLISDFPFPEDNKTVHQAVWLAGLIGVVARASINGPMPLIGFDGNCPGSGKSKQADLIAGIASGRRMPRTVWPAGRNADEEIRKRITSVALAVETFVLLDNVDSPIGGGPLDAALTSDTWKDRQLGSMKITPELPMRTAWFASGNNLQFRGDFVRRVLANRVESLMENPETRTGFKYKDVVGHAIANRSKLVPAVLTILRAFYVNGAPELVPPLGSYEQWTHAVIDPICWLMKVNPLDVRAEIKSQDVDSHHRAALVEGWAKLPGAELGLSVAQALKLLKSTEKNDPDDYEILRSALLDLSNTPDLPSAKSIGRYLKPMLGRNVGGIFLRSFPIRTGVMGWKIEKSPPAKPQGLHALQGLVQESGSSSEESGVPF